MKLLTQNVANKDSPCNGCAYVLDRNQGSSDAFAPTVQEEPRVSHASVEKTEERNFYIYNLCLEEEITSSLYFELKVLWRNRPT